VVAPSRCLVAVIFMDVPSSEAAMMSWLARIG
jgi:hypothetical protein